MSSSKLNLAAVYDECSRQSYNRALIEAERAFINQQVLEISRIQQEKQYEVTSSKSANISKNPHASNSVASTSGTDFQSIVFAKHISQFLEDKPKATIQKAIESAVEEIDDPDTHVLWQRVCLLCSIRNSDERKPISVFRVSEEWNRHVVITSTSALQKVFKEHMENVIRNNLKLARRGGIPGTMSLVEAFLNVRLTPSANYEDGIYKSHPVWCVLFHCMRVGDFSAAASVAEDLSRRLSSSAILKAILKFPTSLALNDHTQEAMSHVDNIKIISEEWEKESAKCRDPYKRAVYSLILGLECDELSNNIENWLWSRLMICKFDNANADILLRKLQRNICADFGEKYFVGNGGNYMLYFTALWLTGQLERAIDVLFRADMRHHAVHIAVLAHQLKILDVSNSPALLNSEPKDPVNCQLNLSKIILLYVKKFETTSLDYTLCYCSFLKDLELDDGEEYGGSIFEACISRLCQISGAAKEILGYIDRNIGGRVPGLVDKFLSPLEVKDVIERVQKEAELTGGSFTIARPMPPSVFPGAHSTSKSAFFNL